MDGQILLSAAENLQRSFEIPQHLRVEVEFYELTEGTNDSFRILYQLLVSDLPVAFRAEHATIRVPSHDLILPNNRDFRDALDAGLRVDVRKGHVTAIPDQMDEAGFREELSETGQSVDCRRRLVSVPSLPLLPCTMTKEDPHRVGKRMGGLLPQ
jgi:hypothetical protein